MNTENLILSALPQRKYARLFDKLQSVTLDVRHVIVEQGKPVRFIYFPTTAMLSLLSMSRDGKRGVGVSAMGNEGMVGVSVFLGDGMAPGRAIVQVAGRALRVESGIFREVVRRGGPLSDIISRYAQVQLLTIMSSAFCNAFHKVDARLARWLLMTQDKTGSDTFPLTHEFAASLLGLHRPAVTVVAHKLLSAGLISYSHGQITILDRRGLKAFACECYGAVQSEYSRLLGDLLTPSS